MQDQDATPRVWALPPEPPVGTTVANEVAQCWRRTVAGWQEVARDDHRQLYDVVESWMDVLLRSGGEVREVVPTRAETVASVMEAVAGYLRAAPHLVPPSSVDEVEIRLPYDMTADQVVAWADALGAVVCRLRYPGRDTVEVCGTELSPVVTVTGFRAWAESEADLEIGEDGRFPVWAMRRFGDHSVDDETAGV